MSDLRKFDSFGDALEYSRLHARPVEALVNGCRMRVFPSGTAVSLGTEERLRAENLRIGNDWLNKLTEDN